MACWCVREKFHIGVFCYWNDLQLSLFAFVCSYHVLRRKFGSIKAPRRKPSPASAQKQGGKRANLKIWTCTHNSRNRQIQGRVLWAELCPKVRKTTLFSSWVCRAVYSVELYLFRGREEKKVWQWRLMHCTINHTTVSEWTLTYSPQGLEFWHL